VSVDKNMRLGGMKEDDERGIERGSDRIWDGVLTVGTGVKGRVWNSCEGHFFSASN
jgi:hypothetical protein